MIPARPVYTPRSGRANRGPHKQVFVCGVAERSGPVRQDTVLKKLRAVDR
jgi:hypothetical protein